MTKRLAAILTIMAGVGFAQSNALKLCDLQKPAHCVTWQIPSTISPFAVTGSTPVAQGFLVNGKAENTAVGATTEGMHAFYDSSLFTGTITTYQSGGALGLTLINGDSTIVRGGNASAQAQFDMNGTLGVSGTDGVVIQATGTNGVQIGNNASYGIITFESPGISILPHGTLPIILGGTTNSRSILPDVGSTYDLGSGSDYWANLYNDYLWVGQAISMHSGTVLSFYSSGITGGNIHMGLDGSGNLAVVGSVIGNLWTFSPSGASTSYWDILPYTTDARNLGGAGQEWLNLYAKTGHFGTGGVTVTSGGLAVTGGGVSVASGGIAVTGGSYTDTLAIQTITGSTQCLQVDSSGAVSGFGAGCGGGYWSYNSIPSTVSPSYKLAIGTTAVGVNYEQVHIIPDSGSHSAIRIEGGFTQTATLVNVALSSGQTGNAIDVIPFGGSSPNFSVTAGGGVAASTSAFYSPINGAITVLAYCNTGVTCTGFEDLSSDGSIFTKIQILGGGGITMGSTPGVTCSGAPSSSFATIGGVVTHC